ncbi:sulfatase family protein [Fimbriiglobus ruber]|uniref:Choline-sulfatase n=1 Tax=Fimbriiglobus ruber TaxID=1908690 RepID=A0A225DQ79_9BACT|nr:arylsulfatase [Fimbriiglobus ruber]OWK39686.1 Choline-sulfatase [Fimbriiglobus ruber]
MKPCFLAMAMILVSFSRLAAAEPATPARPNIVILLADDMGFGDLGVQNPDSKIPTPNLDRLAKEGTRFTDAHSSSGVCTPSRYALLHGRFHWRKFHGIVNSFDQTVLDKDRVTLPGLLKTKGYRTACIGKWHLGWDWKAIQKPGTKPGAGGYSPDAFDWSKPIPGGPLAFGFDYYFGDDVPNFPPYTWFENDRVLAAPTVAVMTRGKPAEGAWEARPGPSVKDWDFAAVMPKLTQRAVEWIGKQKAEEPFFLYFPFTSPHAPIVPAKEFVGTSKANGYGDYMAQTDWAAGEVLKALEKHGLDKNTLVIFSSDNGPERYAYDRVKNHQHRSMGPLRGVKRDLWEGGHRVPLVARWPGAIAAGAVSDGLVSQVDVFATVAAIVGYDIPAGSGEDSYNQLPLLLGKAKSARDAIVHNTNANGYAVRSGDWVYVDVKTGSVTPVPAWFNETNGYKDNPHPGELYNLRDDLAEKNNLYAEKPEKVAEMKALLAKIRARGQVRW